MSVTPITVDELSLWLTVREATCPDCNTTRRLSQFRQVIYASVPVATVMVICECGGVIVTRRNLMKLLHWSRDPDFDANTHALDGHGCRCHWQATRSDLDRESLLREFDVHARDVQIRARHATKPTPKIPYWGEDLTWDYKKHRWIGLGCVCDWNTGRPDWDDHALQEAFDQHAERIQRERYSSE